jgi:hypothetical protein
MSNFDNIGKLMHLPLASIEPAGEFSESEFLVTVAAESVVQSGGRNWVPLIVKEIADYQYQVVSNYLVYAVAQKADLERVWCIVIDPEGKNIEQAKILARETLPKVNLNTASRETILAALNSLMAEPGSPLKGVKTVVAANRIAEANREGWSDFSLIPNLKCGITKGKKLDALAQVFYISPAVKPEPPPAPEVVSIKRASRDEIFERLNYLSAHKIGGFESVEPEKAADAIFTASKGKWKSLNPISKLEGGIDTAKIKTLKTVFTL